MQSYNKHCSDKYQEQKMKAYARMTISTRSEIGHTLKALFHALALSNHQSRQLRALTCEITVDRRIVLYQQQIKLQNVDVWAAENPKGSLLILINDAC